MAATQQGVIKKFMQSLNNTNLYRYGAVDEAIRACSSFTGTEDLVNHFLADWKNAASGDAFLKDSCGIILNNADTGAITGSDAGGSAVKTKDSVVPESGSGYSFTGTSFTKNGLTVTVPDQSSLTSAQKTIVNGLYSWWIEEGLNLVEESYGMSFRDSGATVKTITLKFYTDDTDDALASVRHSYSSHTGRTSSLTLNVNMAYYGSIQSSDKNGAGSSTSFYLDRTLAHELTHAVMAANVLNFHALPDYLAEGLAELVHGIDDDRAYTIKNLANKSSNLDEFLPTSGNTDVSGWGGEEYAAGYMLLRYLAKQGAGDEPADTGVTVSGTTLTVTDVYADSNLEAAIYSTSIIKIDAGGRTRAIRITGNGNGNDILGSSAADTLAGGAGADTLTGGGGADTFLYAKGDGDDVVTDYAEGQDVIRLTSGEITGSSLSGSDVVLKVGSGSITVKNAQGKEITVTDATGSTTAKVYGEPETEPGDGTATVSGLSIRNDENSVTVEGSAGADYIVNTGYYATIKAGAGNDTIKASVGNDTIKGMPGYVLIYGGEGDDSIDNLLGHSTVYGGAGNDSIRSQGSLVDGGAGDDYIYIYGVNNPTVTGGAGRDTIDCSCIPRNPVITDFSVADDVLKIRRSDTQFTSSLLNGNVVLTDAEVAMQLMFQGFTDVTELYDAKVLVGEQEKRLQDLLVTDGPGYIMNGSDFVEVYGSDGTDNIVNSGFGATITASTGNDTIKNEAMNALIYGGEGDDSIDDLGHSTVYGGVGNDSIRSAGSLVDGGAGDDYIYIYGVDNPTVTGGTGRDTIECPSFLSKAVITDFSAAEDVLKLSSKDVSFTSVVSDGNLILTDAAHNLALTFRGITDVQDIYAARVLVGGVEKRLEDLLAVGTTGPGTGEGTGSSSGSSGFSSLTQAGVYYFLASEAEGQTTDVIVVSASSNNAVQREYTGKYYVKLSTRAAVGGVANITSLALVQLRTNGSTGVASKAKLAALLPNIRLIAAGSVKFAGNTYRGATGESFTLDGEGYIQSGSFTLDSATTALKAGSKSAQVSISYTGKGSTATISVGTDGTTGYKAVTSVKGLDVHGEALTVKAADGTVTVFTNKQGVVEKKVNGIVVGTIDITEDPNLMEAEVEAAPFTGSFSFGRGTMGYFEAGEPVGAYGKRQMRLSSHPVQVRMSAAANRIAAIVGAEGDLDLDAGKRGLSYDRSGDSGFADRLAIRNVGGSTANFSLLDGDTVQALGGATVKLNGAAFAVASAAQFTMEGGEARLASGMVRLDAGPRKANGAVVLLDGTAVTAVSGSIRVDGSGTVSGLAKGMSFTVDDTTYVMKDKTKLVKPGEDGTDGLVLDIGSDKAVTVEELAGSWSAMERIEPKSVAVNLAAADKKLKKDASYEGVYAYNGFESSIAGRKVTATLTESRSVLQVAAGTAAVSGDTSDFTFDGSEAAVSLSVTGAAGWQILTGSGDDSITAKGRDTISAGDGTNVITGGGKANIYVHTAGAKDTIKGFRAASDTLLLEGFGAASFTGYTGTTAKNVVLTDNSGGSVTLLNMAKGQVRISDGTDTVAAFFLGDKQKSAGYVEGAYYYGAGAGSMLTLATDKKYGTAKNAAGDTLEIDLGDAGHFKGIAGIDGRRSANRMALTAGENGATLTGGSFESVLKGGAGADSLIGGSGADTFTFDGYAGADRVSGYATGKDTIQLAGGFENYAIDGSDVKLYGSSESGSVTLEKMAKGKAVTIKDTNGDAASYYFGRESSANTFTGKDGMKDVYLVNEDVKSSQKKQTIKLFGTEDEIRIQLNEGASISSIQDLADYFGGTISSKANSKGIYTSTLTDSSKKTILSVTGVDLANGVDVSTSNGVATITAKK